jgi:XRE family transcriptional regulator, regulator of sulfur utilization
MRITARDAAVATIAAVITATLALTARAEPEVMGSRAIPWESLKAEPTKVGEVRHVFQAPTATLDELESHITTLNPGQVPHAPHRHPDEEVLCLKEGSLEANADGQITRVGPGSVLFFASNHLHGVRNVGTTPAGYFIVKWNSPGMLAKKSK